MAIYGFQSTHSLKVHAFQTLSSIVFTRVDVCTHRIHVIKTYETWLFLVSRYVSFASVLFCQLAPPFPSNPFLIRFCTRNVTPCHFGPISR